MDATSFWMCAYHYNLFGDPALRQYGRLTGTQEAFTTQVIRHFDIYPNPSPGHITVHMPLETGETQPLYLYDECGRLVRNLTVPHDNGRPLAIDLDVPCGVYFAVVKNADAVFCKKIVIMQ
jgi:hypothetical protein